MLPLLREAPAARIVNVSNGVGSLTRNSDPAYAYRSIFGPGYAASKTALNAMTLAMAIELESTGIKINAACPGYTKTNLNNYTGTRTVEEGMGAITYNAVHTYVGPLVLAGYSFGSNRPALVSLSLVWIAHIGLDRMLGFGLKYPTRFNDTHLNPDRHTLSIGN